MKVPRFLQIDAELPPSGLARWATVAGMVVGGLVAVLVVVFFGLLVAGGWTTP